MGLLSISVVEFFNGNFGFFNSKKGMTMRKKKSILGLFFALFQVSACYADTLKCDENLGVEKYYGSIVSFKESSVAVLNNELRHSCGIDYKINKISDKNNVDITSSISKKEDYFPLLIENQYKSDMCARILTTAHNGWKVDYIEVCYLDNLRVIPRLVGVHVQGGVKRNE
ncbi:hypothetical protein [Serratia quinivorans]